MNENGDDIESQVADEVKAEHAINIAKVDSDSFSDNEDGDTVEGSFKGTIYKDDNGNAFIYLTSINGSETEDLEMIEHDMEDEEERERPKNAGAALDIFILKGKNKKNADSGY